MPVFHPMLPVLDSIRAYGLDGDGGALHCHHDFAACATCPGSWWWVVATAEHIFAAVMSFPFNDLKQTRRGRAAPRQAALGLNTGVLFVHIY